ncbi:MAG: endonuclease/exonuclease/phosphatase family protein [Candidatus Binatia bacterium]
MRTLLTTCLLLSLVIPAHAAKKGNTLVVLTQNQYLGTDFTPIVVATTPAELNQAVLEALAQVEANNFPERARALAEQIADWQPEVVGLQEVFRFTLNGATTPGVAPFIDQLDETLHALNALGAHYVVGASVENSQLTLPVDFTGDSVPDAAVGVTDRDVLLVRSDIPFNVVPFSQICARPSQDGGPGCNYQFVATVGPITLERGFVGIDATIKGRDYRFVTTHLEVREVSEALQAVQAAELIGTLQLTTPAGRSLVVMGDMNSLLEDPAPSDQIIPPYLQFIAANFSDIWDLRPGSPPESTCCQAADLLNHRSELYERIDLIFTDFLPRKVKARLLGTKVSDKTRPNRLWPSDHAAVVAEITVD